MTQTTLRDYLLTTEDAISAGRVNDAMANCQYILTHFPESLEAQRLLGEVYLAEGQLDEAQQAFDWILANDPENVIVYCDRALISEHMRDYDTALDCYQQAYELSRGNSEIRHEFNQLSEKMGQAGFIFSRAGLARLYMRGDLLPQAIQEWEVVLTVSPDRLDARTGLLEALWREGLYDRVEHLATQILDDVPHCLKALLLLAHVTFVQNALNAQELMRLAETLDPDLIKAQELFNDFMAHTPKDPFLNLLKKAPKTLPTTSDEVQAETTATPAEQLINSTNGANGTNSSHDSTPFADPLARWGNLDNVIEAQPDHQSVQESSPFGNWTDHSTTDFGGWSTFGQPPEPAQPAAHVSTNTVQPVNDTTMTPDSPNQLAHNGETLGEFQSEPEPIAQSAERAQTNEIQQPSNEEQPPSWYHMDVLEEPSFDSWNNLEQITPSSSDISWGTNAQESEVPAPPAWLDMLTKSEEHQPDTTALLQSTTPPGEPQETPVVSPSLTDQQEPIAQELEMPFAWSDEKPTSTIINPPSLDEEEPFSFSPEWLKSLGATAMESDVQQNLPQAEETPPHALPAQPSFAEPAVLQELVVAVPAPPLPALDAEEASAMTPVLPEAQEKVTLENWLEHATQQLTRPEQNTLTTLEKLENDLRSQGFMPLQPGSLSSIADRTDETTLSSALAQLGNLASQPRSQEAVSASSEQQDTPYIPPVEPLWATSPVQPVQTTQVTPQPILNQATSAVQRPQRSATPNHLDALSSFVSSATPVPVVSIPAEPVDTTSSNVIAQALPQATPTTVPSVAPAIHPDLLFDMELETTMKRPVVRLQPMQQPQATQQNQAMPKGRYGERSTTGKTNDGSVGSIGSMGYKERLLRGYQHQLAGAYDEAMQEYRVIIRNAPDLLSEVVSNMRALLKLAPKYSAGYRVLGDAYMRQGEYLQAMEAYNKALAMAKKVKS